MPQQSSLFFDLVILTLIKLMDSLRSKTGIIRILKGSMAKQTLQDTYFFRLGSFYGIFHGLSYQGIERYIDQLHHNNHVIIENNDKLKITSEGLEYLSSIQKMETGCSFNGAANSIIITHIQKKRFKDRLNLLVQVLSNIQNGEKLFSPIIQDIDIQLWVKEILLPLQKDKIEEVTKKLHKELEALSNFLTIIEQQLFLLRLSGNHRTAYTWSQLADRLDRPIDEMKICHDYLFYKLMLIICKDKNFFIFLFKMMGVNINNFLSPSSKETKRLIKLGMSIDEIAKIRKLKKSTIYDHLIDVIMLNDGTINLPRYVDYWKIQEISKLFSKSESNSLTYYKQNLNQKISYMDIKIVLATLIAKEGREIC